MAQNRNQQEVKQQVLRRIAEERTAISREVQRMRWQLSPKLVLRRLVDQHIGLVVLMTAATGGLSGWLICRDRRSFHQNETHGRTIIPRKPSHPVLGALLLGGLGFLTKRITPAVIRSIILPRLIHAFSHNHRRHDQGID